MNTDELRRLDHGPLAGEKPEGLGTEKFTVHCASDAQQVLARSKEVLRIVLAQDVARWPTDEEWRSLLPDWFVAACADEQTVAQEMQRWFELSEKEQAAATSKLWSVGNWVYWFLPDQREWFWWDASIRNAGTIEVLVQVYGEPFPWGALEWLLLASGAIKIKREI